jgi:hypothetical protein
MSTAGTTSTGRACIRMLDLRGLQDLAGLTLQRDNAGWSLLQRTHDEKGAPLDEDSAQRR